MFGKKKKSPLEIVADRTVLELEDYPIGSEGHAKTLGVVVQLQQMLEEEKSHRLNRNTMVIVAANLLGILMIIRHEHVNVITSRAMSLLIKPKIGP